jgi:hypothetical protein
LDSEVRDRFVIDSSTLHAWGRNRSVRMKAMDIGNVGVWTSDRPFGIERAGEAAKLVEQLGYGAWWVGGSPHVPDIRPILEATSTLVAATGILNVWSNEPGETAAATRSCGRTSRGGSCSAWASAILRRPATTVGR